MGHLINPVAVRVGWLSSWSDSWFSEYIYYPEYLHAIFRIRFFLIYFFSSKVIEKIGYFYSHFEIVLKYNYLYVRVFFYDGQVEGIMDNLFFNHHLDVKRLNFNPERRLPMRFFEAWKVLVVFNWIHSFFIYSWPFKKIKYLIRAINLLDNFNVYRYFLSWEFQVRCRGSAARTLFLYTLYIHVKYKIDKTYAKKGSSTNLILSRFVYCMALHYWNESLFLNFSMFLSFVFSNLSYFIKNFIDFFALNSFAINARFLSRYIAKKLKQNYSLTELINPITTELKILSSFYKYSMREHFYHFLKYSREKNNVSIFRRGIFRTSLLL